MPHRLELSQATGPRADPGEVVLGVDTHKDLHVGAVISPLGGPLGSRGFPATSAGYRQLLCWARGFGTVERAGVEATGSYGAGLTRYLRAERIQVIEINQPDRAGRRRHGKTDELDAQAAARAVLSGRATTTPKAGDGPVEMLGLYKLAKASATKSRTQAINQLKAVLIRADPPLRESLSGLSNRALIRRCAQLTTNAPSNVPHRDIATAASYTSTRLRWDPRTRDYLTRRTTEGKTPREARRCLKRYIAREIYQLIKPPPQLAAP